MTIIDAQVYIWAADTLERPWSEYGKGYEQLIKNGLWGVALLNG